MSRDFYPYRIKSAFFLALPLVGACSLAGPIAKDSAADATSYYSSEHFTLVSSIPPNFGFSSKAQYFPRAGQTCSVYVSALGGEVTRHQQKTDRTDAKTIEQTVRFEIPLEFHIAGYTMDLMRVNTELEGRYGPSPLDIGGDGGGISIRNIDNKRRPELTEEPRFRGICTWMFQLSVARIQKDGISKILSCDAADERWNVSEDRYERGKPGGALNRSDLAGKVVHLELRQSPDETPTSDAKWQKFPNGWKPCLGKGIEDPYGFCRGNTKDFRTFRMNGRTCTIYPGCTD